MPRDAETLVLEPIAGVEAVASPQVFAPLDDVGRGHTCASNGRVYLHLCHFGATFIRSRNKL